MNLPPLIGRGRVAIFGGSFDPPHLGHVLMALAVLATEDLDDMWIVPCADHPFQKNLVQFSHRIAMCRLASRHFSKVQIVDIESELPAPSYTVQTLRAIHDARPGIQPVFIAGSDVLPDLPRWREPEELEKLARLVIVPRPGYPGGTTLKVDLPMTSSTQVRESIRAGSDVVGYVDHDVAVYIEKHSLYKEKIDL